MTRLWVAGALRRPLRAVVLVLALLAISATTIGALVAADGLASRFDRDARAEWGSVDVEGRATRTSVFDDSLGRFLVEKAGVAGAPRLVLPVAVSTDRAAVQGLVLGLGAEERSLGEYPTAELGPDQVLLNARLAGRLHVDEGDEVRLVVAVPEWNETRSDVAQPLVHKASAVTLSLRVAKVVPDQGVADLHRTPNALVTRSVLQQATGLQPAKSTVLDLRATAPGKDAAKALIDALDPTARRAGVALKPVKEDSLAIAADEGGLFRSILLTLAVLVVAAAFGGTVDLVLALLRERSAEIALFRALGAPRRRLQRAVVVEVTTYGAVGAGLGVLAGVPAAGAVARALADHLSDLDAGRGREALPLTTDVRPLTVVIGALLVLGVAALAGAVAARRALAVEPDLLLRDSLATAPRALSPRRPVLLLALGALCVGAGTSVAALLFLGLTLCLAALWTWLRRSRDVDRWAAVAGLVWSVGGAALLGDFSQGVQAGFGVITVAGEVAVACGCVLLVPVLRRAMRAVRVYTARGSAQLALTVAGASAERARARSGLAMGVVAGAFFGVAALMVLGSAAALPPAQQAGGFTSLGTSVATVDRAALLATGADAVVAVPHADLPERGYRTEDSDGNRSTVPYPVRLIATEPELAAQQQWGLVDALPQYRTARDALTAVVTDGDKAVVDRYARPEGAQPGDDVVLDLGAGPRRFHLIAVLDTFLVNGAFVSDSAFRETGLAHGDTLVLARGGSVAALEAAGRTAGLDLDTVEEAAADVVAVNRSFTDVFAIVLGLALLIAVVSMAAGVVRAGRERRGELGVLRALGLRRRGVVLLLAGEPVLVGALGIALGSVVGVGVLRALFAAGYSDLPFVLSLGRLALLAASVLVLLALTCALAAWPASRRTVDSALADLG